MRSTILFAVASALLSSTVAHAESVAETVERLTREVAALRNRVEFFNSKGKSIGYMGLSSADAGFLSLNDVTGYPTVKIDASGKGGWTDYYNSDRKLVLSIGTSAVSGGFARFFNQDGREIAFIGGRVSGKGGLWIEGHEIGDLSEVFELATRERVVPGTVMIAAGDGRRVQPSVAPYDSRVVGVISGAGGLEAAMQIGSREDQTADLPIALAGQVYVRVCLESGDIRPGDLLVSSSRPGVAMRASERDKSFGAVLGKALEPYTAGTGEGLVRMLVMMR